MAACNLNRHQQRAEGEHKERQRHRDGGIEDRTRTGRAQSEQRPSKAEVKFVQQPRQDQFEQNRDERHEPQRGPDIFCRRAQSMHGRSMVLAVGETDGPIVPALC